MNLNCDGTKRELRKIKSELRRYKVKNNRFLLENSPEALKKFWHRSVTVLIQIRGNNFSSIYQIKGDSTNSSNTSGCNLNGGGLLTTYSSSLRRVSRLRCYGNGSGPKHRTLRSTAQRAKPPRAELRKGNTRPVSVSASEECEDTVRAKELPS